MRCDRTLRSGLSSLVSIPAGFSDALRPDTSIEDSTKQTIVSIPAGFSDALRPGSEDPQMRSDVVSIPAGFSDALRHLYQYAESCCATFQSLLGFLMRCDKGSIVTSKDGNWFQSLLGFLMRCDNTRDWRRADRI